MKDGIETPGAMQWNSAKCGNLDVSYEKYQKIKDLYIKARIGPYWDHIAGTGFIWYSNEW